MRIGMLVPSWIPATMTLLTACGGGDGGPAAVCVPGERTCDEAGTGVQVCTEDGTGFEPLETCIAGASCQEGSCACPGGQVTGAEACLSVGVLDCPPWAPPDGDGICTPEVPQCGAGQSPALDLEGGCVAVGVETCPEGWERLADATCSPVLPGCGEGQLATFDGACTVTGPADDCGTAGPFGNLEGDAGAVWVAADSPGATATGSRAMPFPTIVEALDVVPDGGTVLVGSGVYPGGLHIDRPVHIRGRCATEVTIQGAASVTLDTWGDIPMEALMVVQETGGVELAGLTLDDGVTVKGQRAVGLLAVGSPGLLLRDLRVLHAGGAGLDLDACPDAEIRNVEVRGLTVRDGNNPFGQGAYGLRLRDSPALVTDSLFLENEGADLYADSSCLDLSFSHFQGRGGVTAIAPLGVWAEACDGEGHRVRHCRFLDKMTHGLKVRGARLTVEDCRFEEGVTDYDDLNGPALLAEDCEVTIRRNWLRENQLASISVVRSEGIVEENRLEDTIGSDPSLNGGEALIVSECDPGPVTVRSNSILGSRGSGIVFTSSFGEIRGNHVIETLDPPTEQGRGAGINVVFGSDAVVEGNRVEDSRYAGIRVADAFGTVAHNLVASGSQAFDGFGGAGILLEKGAHLAGGVRGNFLVDNVSAGILSSSSHYTEMSGNLVTGTRPSPQGCAWGIAVDGGSGALRGNRLTANPGGGIHLAGNLGPVEHNVVDGNGSSKGPTGGIVVQDTTFGTVSVEGNTVSDNRFVGIALHASDFTLLHNTVSGQVGGEGGGMGIWAEGEGAGEIRRSRIRNNQLAGIGAWGIPDLEVAGNHVSGTRAASVGDMGNDTAAGIAAFSGAFVAALYNEVENNRGPGLLFHDGAEGSVDANRIVDNDGAAIQLSASVVAILANAYSGNGTDGTLDETADGPSAALGPWPICTPPETGL